MGYEKLRALLETNFHFLLVALKDQASDQKANARTTRKMGQELAILAKAVHKVEATAYELADRMDHQELRSLEMGGKVLEILDHLQNEGLGKASLRKEIESRLDQEAS